VDYSPRQEYSGAFEEVDIPEEQKLKENRQNRGKVLEIYIRPSRRPLYSLQVQCLVAISRYNHPKEQIHTLFYNFKQRESEEYYWNINISDPYPRAIGLNLQQYTELQLVRYIKPRFLDWVKAGGYKLYQQRKGWVTAQGIGEPLIFGKSSRKRRVDYWSQSQTYP
jgi:hypothetical protein